MGNWDYRLNTPFPLLPWLRKLSCQRCHGTLFIILHAGFLFPTRVSKAAPERESPFRGSFNRQKSRHECGDHDNVKNTQPEPKSEKNQTAKEVHGYKVLLYWSR